MTSSPSLSVSELGLLTIAFQLRPVLIFEAEMWQFPGAYRNTFPELKSTSYAYRRNDTLAHMNVMVKSFLGGDEQCFRGPFMVSERIKEIGYSLRLSPAFLLVHFDKIHKKCITKGMTCKWSRSRHTLVLNLPFQTRLAWGESLSQICH